MRSVSGFVGVFSERRRLPRIEMDLVLEGDAVAFSPSVQEVIDMISSVVVEVSH